MPNFYDKFANYC